MSQVPAVLDLKTEDLQKLLACHVHLGAKNLNPAMRRYVWKRNPSGHHVLNLGKTWEKLILAARVIVAIENPADVCVISSRPWGQRAVLKFAQYTGAHAIAGRYTPGSFTNQLQEKYIEPRLLVVTDPHSDHQPIIEASYANIPTIAFCTSDSRLQYVDVAIPANNTARRSIGLLYWLLAREVLYLRGTIKRSSPWDVMVDLFFYRDDNSQKQRQSEEAFSDEFQRGVPSMLPSAGTVDSVTGGDGTGEWGATDATATWLAGEGSTGAAAAAAAWESVPAPADWSQDQTNPTGTNPPAPDQWANALPATNWETPA